MTYVPCGAPFTDLSGTVKICNVVAGHIGSHQYIRGAESVLCNAPFPSGTVTGLSCALATGHPGDHDAGAFTWPAEEPAPVVQCGEKITWYEPGTETCRLRAGHRGLHYASGSGDYIGGRTVEDVLVEAFQRISELEARPDENRINDAMQVLERRVRSALDEFAWRMTAVEKRLGKVDRESDRGLSWAENRLTKLEQTNTQAPVTHGDLNAALSTLESSVTERLTRIESLVRDVSTKVSQLHVTDSADCGEPGSGDVTCGRAPGHTGWHMDRDGHSTWLKNTLNPEPDRCGDLCIDDQGSNHICARETGHTGAHRDHADPGKSDLLWS